MKFAAKKDDAVSPVIGTILLVAITVVLVAIIAAVVMPMVGGMNTTHITGIQVDTAKHTVTLTSGEVPDSLTISGTNVAWDSSATPSAGSVAIGEVYKFTTGTTDDVQASITAKYKDGSEQVIWTGTATKTVTT